MTTAMGFSTPTIRIQKTAMKSEVDGVQYMCNAQTDGDAFDYWYTMTCGESDVDIVERYDDFESGTYDVDGNPTDTSGETQSCYDYHLGVAMDETWQLSLQVQSQQKKRSCSSRTSLWTHWCEWKCRCDVCRLRQRWRVELCGFCASLPQA